MAGYAAAGLDWRRRHDCARIFGRVWGFGHYVTLALGIRGNDLRRVPAGSWARTSSQKVVGTSIAFH